METISNLQQNNATRSFDRVHAFHPVISGIYTDQSLNQFVHFTFGTHTLLAHWLVSMSAFTSFCPLATVTDCTHDGIHSMGWLDQQQLMKYDDDPRCLSPAD